MEPSSTLPSIIGRPGATLCPAKAFRITRGQFLATFGQRNDSILRQWLGEKATPELIQRIGNTKEALYRQHVREHGIAPLPGALEWVNLLHRQGWRQAIASAAPRANIETILDVLSRCAGCLKPSCPLKMCTEASLTLKSFSSPPPNVSVSRLSIASL